MQLPAIALAQLNVTVGDIAGNAQKIHSAYETVCAKGAELVVFPELCLIGYPPEDLVLMPAFRKKAMEALSALAHHTTGKAAMIVGSVWDNSFVTSGQDKNIYNAAVLMDEGRILHVQPKTMLPNEGIFDEKRLFGAESPETIPWRGHMLGIMICEDVWHEHVANAHKSQGAELLIVINASPFELGKMYARQKIISDTVGKNNLPLVYVNLVGGQDDIVFDGGSFVFTSPSHLEGEGGVGGRPAYQMKEFEEDVQIFSFKDSALRTPPPDIPPQWGEEFRLWSAMKLGLRDYVEKNHFPGVLIGLSGGIDSALTAAVAVDALGAKRVRGVLLPSPYTSQDSVEDALLLAKNLGIETLNIPITPAMDTMKETLDAVFLPTKDWMEDVSIGGNLQARLRGVTLMALSNQSGFMLMSTGNKSEIAVGYTTLYGDSCGGYNVIKDLYKTQIYALAKWRNVQEKIIPERSITKAPTAELKPGQKDQDHLPPYETLDAILHLHIEQRYSASEIISRGYDSATVHHVARLVRMNEYKRRQSCPGVKLSPMLFGKDRRYPLTQRYES